MPSILKYRLLFFFVILTFNSLAQRTSNRITLDSLSESSLELLGVRIFVADNFKSQEVPTDISDENFFTKINRVGKSNDFILLKYSTDIYFVLSAEYEINEGNSNYVVFGFIDAYGDGKLNSVDVSIPTLNFKTKTNNNGYFLFEGIPQGNYDIVFGKAGYATDFSRLVVNQDTRIDFTLFEKSIQLDEVSVYAERSSEEVESTNVGVTKFSMDKLDRIPTFMGETDVVKSVTVLPGVSNSGDGVGGGFNVRGGAPDQNLILFDHAPIFWGTHLFGFIPIFNSDVIDDIEISKGSISAQNGGRVSSLLSLSHKNADFKERKISGSLGLVSSKLSIETPIVNDKLSLLSSARVAYPNVLLSSVNVPELVNSGANFYDYNFKATYRNKSNFKTSISHHLSVDNFNFDIDTSYQVMNAVSVFNFNYFPNDFYEFSGTLSTSSSTFNINNTNVINSYKYSSGIRNTYFNFLTRYLPESFIDEITSGITVQLYDVDNGELLFSQNELSGNNIILADDRLVENALYINSILKPFDWFNVSMGLRYSFTYNLGTGTTNGVNSSLDSLGYGKGEFYNFTGGLEPRLSLSTILNDNNSIKIGYSKIRQYLNSLSNNGSIVPVNIWQVSNSDIIPLVSDQVSLGYVKIIPEIKGQLTLETYYKEIKNSIDFLDNTELLLNEVIESDLIQGTSENYGIEFLYEKKLGLLKGWFSYTYSRSFQTSKAEEGQSINNGEKYPSYFDTPHNLSLSISYRVNAKLDFGFNFNYLSGRPITTAIGQFEQSGIIVPVYSERNEDRTPAYHRADMSLTFKPNRLKSNAKLDYSINLSIYNIYGRRNPYTIFFRNGGVSGVPEAYKLSIIGVPFPALSVNFRL